MEGGGAGCSHTPQIEMPQCWSPGNKTAHKSYTSWYHHFNCILIYIQCFTIGLWGIIHVLCNNKISCHITLYNCKHYRIIELDGSDVILGQGNASILTMDEQESLREENDFP